MLNEPPPRRPHPLEVKPEIPPPAPERQQARLHIPSVSPHLTRALIAINVIIYVMFGLLQPNVYRDMVISGANQHYAVLREGEYYRLLTAMFLHADLAHLFFNMYALYLIGGRIERLFGHARFALIYFLGGLAGSLLSVLFNSGLGFSVGASGAVFAIFGAELVYLYQHRKLLGEAGRREFRSLLWVAAMNFAIGIFSSINARQGGIDNWGHVGGLLGGVILSWYIAPFFLLKRHPVNENAFIAEDVNPLKNRYQAVSLYVAGLLIIMIAAERLIQ